MKRDRQSVDPQTDKELRQLEHLSKEGSIWNLIKTGDLDGVKRVIEKNESKESESKAVDYANERGPFGETILHVSILLKQNEVAKYLIKRLPDLTDLCYETEQYQGETALHMAVANHNQELAQLLLDQGADPNKARATGTFFQASGGTVYYGEHAIAFAVCTNQPEMVRLLHRKGASLDVVDAMGNSVWHHCARIVSEDANDAMTMFDELVSLHKAEDSSFEVDKLINIRNNEGYSVLQFSVCLHHRELFEHILEQMKIIGWEWGDVSFCAFSLSEIDTWRGAEYGMNLQSNSEAIGSASLAPVNENEDAEELGIQEVMTKQSSTGKRRKVKRNEQSILEIIVRQHRASFMLNPAIYQVYLQKWNKYAKRFFQVWFVMHVLYCICVSYTGVQVVEFIRRDDPPTPWLLMAFVVISLKVISVSGVEGYELYLQCAKYGFFSGCKIYFEHWEGMSVPGMFKFIVWMANGLSIVAAFVIALAWGGGREPKLLRISVILVMIFEWLYTLLFCQAYKSTGRLVITIAKIMTQDISRFAFVYIVVLMGFSSAVTLLQSNENTHGDWLSVMFAMYQISLGTGEFDNDSYDTQTDVVLAQILYAVFLLICLVMLFNLLIAIMSETTKSVKMEATEHWLLQWGSTILLIERRIPPFLRPRTGVPGETFGLAHRANEYFVTFVRVHHGEHKKKLKSREEEFELIEKMDSWMES